MFNLVNCLNTKFYFAIQSLLNEIIATLFLSLHKQIRSDFYATTVFIYNSSSQNYQTNICLKFTLFSDITTTATLISADTATLASWCLTQARLVQGVKNKLMFDFILENALNLVCHEVRMPWRCGIKCKRFEGTDL